MLPLACRVRRALRPVQPANDHSAKSNLVEKWTRIQAGSRMKRRRYMEGEREGEGVEAEDISRIGAHINLVSPNTTHLTICPDGHNATTCTPQPQSAAILATSSAARPIFPSPTPIAKSTQSSVIRNTPTTEDFAAIPIIRAIDHWSALQQAVCKEDWAGLSSQHKGAFSMAYRRQQSRTMDKLEARKMDSQ